MGPNSKYLNRILYNTITLVFIIFLGLSVYAWSYTPSTLNQDFLEMDEIVFLNSRSDFSYAEEFVINSKDSDRDSDRNLASSFSLSDYDDDGFSFEDGSILIENGYLTAGESPNYYAKIGFDVIGNDMGLTSRGDAVAVRDVNGNFFYGGVTYADGIFIKGDTKNVGIGTYNPRSKLNVLGDGNFTEGLVIGDRISIFDASIVSKSDLDISSPSDSLILGGGQGVSILADHRGEFASSQISLSVDGKDNIFINSKGVGIGTRDPQNDLNVVGDVNITETLYVDSVVIEGFSVPDMEELIEEINLMKESLCELGATEWC